MKKVAQISVFKANCLEFIRNGKSVTITKRDVPIAELKPVEKKKRSLIGSMKGTAHIKGDLIKPIF